MHCSRLLTLAHACSRFVEVSEVLFGVSEVLFEVPEVLFEVSEVLFEVSECFFEVHIDTAHACSRLLTLAHGRPCVNQFCVNLIMHGHCF